MRSRRRAACARRRDTARTGGPRRRAPAGGLGVQRLQVGAERVSQPGRRACGAEHHAHRMPGAGHRVAEDVHPRLGIGRIRRQYGEDDAGRSEHDRDRPGRRDADPECCGGLVAGSGDRGRLVRGRQPLLRDLECVADLLRPAPACNVEQERPGGIGRIDRVLAGQPEPHVVLRQQDVADPSPGLRLVLAEPEQLGSREARQGTVAGQLDQPLEPDPRLDLRAFGRCSLVVPEDRRPQHLLVGSERDEPVHLPREADRPLRQARQAGLGGAPPVLGILLREARVGGGERVALVRRREDLPVRRDGDRLDPGGPDVEPDAVGGAHAPSAAYTSSYARTASFDRCASRRAGSSIFAATPSMNRHCRTDRFTAPTASSV